MRSAQIQAHWLASAYPPFLLLNLFVFCGKRYAHVYAAAENGKKQRVQYNQIHYYVKLFTDPKVWILYQSLAPI